MYRIAGGLVFITALLVLFFAPTGYLALRVPGSWVGLMIEISFLLLSALLGALGIGLLYLTIGKGRMYFLKAFFGWVVFNLLIEFAFDTYELNGQGDLASPQLWVTGILFVFFVVLAGWMYAKDILK